MTEDLLVPSGPCGHWLNDGQHEHASRMVAEIGRLLGGWLRQAQGRKKVGTPGP